MQLGNYIIPSVKSVLLASADILQCFDAEMGFKHLKKQLSNLELAFTSPAIIKVLTVKHGLPTCVINCSVAVPYFDRVVMFTACFLMAFPINEDDSSYVYKARITPATDLILSDSLYGGIFCSTASDSYLRSTRRNISYERMLFHFYDQQFPMIFECASAVLNSLPYLHEQVEQHLSASAGCSDIQSLLLYGQSGSGLTTLSISIAERFEGITLSCYYCSFVLSMRSESASFSI
jgi:hypothetical protein